MRHKCLPVGAGLDTHAIFWLFNAALLAHIGYGDLGINGGEDRDYQTPTSLPTQKQLARALHRIVAADLMQDLVASAPVAASWHISCSLPGSGSWLHTMLYVNRVAAKTWQTMLCLCMMALIPEAAGIDRCVSG